MKIRFAALAAITLAALMLLAACSTNSSNSTSTTNTANAGTNASPTTTANPSPMASTTPVTNNSGSSPTDAFKAYYEAIKAKNAEAVKHMFSKETMKMLEEQAKQSNKTVDDVFKEGMEEASKEVPETLPEIRNEKIDGDKASIEIKDEKSGRWETFNLVKEDGEWKVSFTK